MWRTNRLDLSLTTGLVYRHAIAAEGDVGLRVGAGLSVRAAKWTSVLVDLPVEIITYRDVTVTPRPRISPVFGPRVTWSLWMGRAARAWEPDGPDAP